VCERLSQYIESRAFYGIEENWNTRASLRSGFTRVFHVVWLSISAARIHSRCFCTACPAAESKDSGFSILSKGETRSRYKFEVSSNSAIRAATRVTSFPPDYLADGESREDCVGNVYPSPPLAPESASRKISILSLLRAVVSPRGV